MATRVWGGTGELQPGEAYWEISKGRDRGRIVGRPYMRERARLALLRFSYINLEHRKETIAQTIDNDFWLARHNGEVISYVIECVIDHMFETATDKHFKMKEAAR